MTEAIANGQVWEQAWPSCLRSIVQWVGPGDVWCLLSVPQKAVHGGTCMIVHTGPHGRFFYTEAELAQRLRDFNWKKIDAHIELMNDAAAGLLE